MPELNRRNLLWLGIGGAVAWGGWAVFKPIERVRMDMKIKLLQPCRDFFTSNNLDPTGYLYDKRTDQPLPDYRSGTFFFEIKDNIKTKNDVFMEYDITLMNGDGLKLPTARTCYVDREAGHIINFSSYLPVENLTLDEAIAIASQLASHLQQAGGKQTYFPKETITPRTLAENYGMDLHSVWQVPLQGKKATSYYECRLEIVSTQRFTGSTMPPAAALVTSARGKKTVYLINFEVKVADEVRQELARLADARSFHETGQAGDHYIPLVEWYNNPDWRPEGWDGKYV